MPYDLKHAGAVLRQTDQYGIDYRNVFNQTPLMIAARIGNAALVNELREQGANTELVNNAGLNAFQIALEQVVDNPDYRKKKLANVYHLLEPDCIDTQIDERLIKLDKRSMEFIMLNMMMAMFYAWLGEKIVITWGAFESSDFAQLFDHFPEHILPGRRKKRPYISSILSKNEVNREDKYNRKLFVRVKHGHYIFNPKLSLRVEGEWRNIYEILSFDMVAMQHEESCIYIADFNERGQARIERFAQKIKNHAETGSWSEYF